jgi:uncharacterized SAM-binding protein YcdF (DUF218 family)
MNYGFLGIRKIGTLFESHCNGGLLGSKRPMVFRHAQTSGGDLPSNRASSRLLRKTKQAIAVLCLVGLSGFVGGFLVFADQVSTNMPPAAPHADAIVALTGGPQRINDAVNLLANGFAKKLLISGVNDKISVDQLKRAIPSGEPYFQCCIDVGYQARDTRGNANESRDWARTNGFTSLIVVTSAYHMPRSLAELERVMPDVDLIAYPVHHADMNLDRWTREFGTFRLLMVEYLKYLVARLG